MAVLLDARGLRCPWPVLRLARAMREAERVTMLADDPAAPVEVAALASARGWALDVEPDGAMHVRRAVADVTPPVSGIGAAHEVHCDLSDVDVIDHALLELARHNLGAGFGQILGHFREDAPKAIVAIEDAVRVRSAVALVRPAHSLKGEALQFGAVALARAAERIERRARDAVERPDFPLEVGEDVRRLRGLFDAAVAILLREASPATALRRAVGWGRRAPGPRL